MSSTYYAQVVSDAKGSHAHDEGLDVEPHPGHLECGKQKPGLTMNELVHECAEKVTAVFCCKKQSMDDAEQFQLNEITVSPVIWDKIPISLIRESAVPKEAPVGVSDDGSARFITVTKEQETRKLYLVSGQPLCPICVYGGEPKEELLDAWHRKLRLEREAIQCALDEGRIEEFNPPANYNLPLSSSQMLFAGSIDQSSTGLRVVDLDKIIDGYVETSLGMSDLKQLGACIERRWFTLLRVAYSGFAKEAPEWLERCQSTNYHFYFDEERQRRIRYKFLRGPLDGFGSLGDRRLTIESALLLDDKDLRIDGEVMVCPEGVVVCNDDRSALASRVKEVRQALVRAGIKTTPPEQTQTEESVMAWGCELSHNTISPEYRYEAIRNWPYPDTPETRSNFSHFVNCFLNKKISEDSWNEHAFDQCRADLLNIIDQGDMDPSNDLILYTDAGPAGITIVLCKLFEDGHQKLEAVLREPLSADARSCTGRQLQFLAGMTGLLRLRVDIEEMHAEARLFWRPGDPTITPMSFTCSEEDRFCSMIQEQIRLYGLRIREPEAADQNPATCLAQTPYDHTASPWLHSHLDRGREAREARDELAERLQRAELNPPGGTRRPNAGPAHIRRANSVLVETTTPPMSPVPSLTSARADSEGEEGEGEVWVDESPPAKRRRIDNRDDTRV